MNIIIACGAMPFGPDTVTRASLGGSETAALMLGKAIAARGHTVTMFCNLPGHDRPDCWQSGTVHSDGVRYVDLKNFAQFANVNEHDLLIAVRDPGLVAHPTQSKKKVLWMHDIATVRGMKHALSQMDFTFDEIWTVSNWHKYQVAEVTGYPEDRIVALRNGIVKHETLDLGRIDKQLVYAARPERGLDNLIMPGGVMDNLPDYKLLVCMYDHFPDYMRGYYEGIFARMKEMPNVEFIGPKPNSELRQIIRDSAAYIYPTQFEETSCILARECIEQGTPFVTTAVGALPETLSDCGIFFDEWLHENGITEPERGSQGWCKLFAQYFRDVMADQEGLVETARRCAAREDLYWDGVAAMAEEHFEPKPVTLFSRMFSLLQDGDAVPARALFQYVYGDYVMEESLSPAMRGIASELRTYDFINGDIAKYYDELYTSKEDSATELTITTEGCGPRYEALCREIAMLPPESIIFEYGCGAGHIIVPLARKFPQHKFVGFDFAKSAVEVIEDGVDLLQMKNLRGVSQEPPPDRSCDFVICSEVLEHVVEPWKLLEKVEGYAKPGGRVFITVPFGGWEPLTYEQKGRWKERAHLWHIDLPMIKEMCGGEFKPEHKTLLSVTTVSEWCRPIGNLIHSFAADHKPILPVDPLAKALRHHSRETVSAAIIAYNNEDTIVKLFNSIDKKVQFVNIALGPCTDHTRERIVEWFADRPYMRYSIIDVPKIEVRKFSFADARNKSVEGLEQDFEWFLWIDTDEYLSGEIRKYLRNSANDGYIIAQHHFTVEPRGNPPEIDRPARLCRTDRKYAAKGYIHEHFEVPASGPGRCYMLPDVDIGHPGYVNEAVRQGRFFRNFPFLEWEHEEGGDRKLHKFLWFRDIIHRMRFLQDPMERVRLAQEAVSYYNDHQPDMATFGPGLFMSLKYLAEANTVLGIGVPIKIAVQLDDRDTMLEGRFANFEQIENVLRQLLADEFKERTSRYY